ncbi:MAG: HEAT repeat domain-containing protein [Planctomycetaceae bacterium]|nr:HEAT repeat domain-containing protein [Planctomycetaceae bacterium]
MLKIFCPWSSRLCARTVVLAIAGLSLTILSHADEAAIRQVTEADMPRIPHTEPQAALGTFRTAKGFRLEQVAAEPLVGDPVDACFDEFGRMFVAEMHGYPFSQEPTKLNPEGGGAENAGIIRMLQDTDNDGQMDRSVVFADNISWPTSVCCYDGGVFVLAPQYLYYFRDTDGDGKADIRRIVLQGFGRDNVQAVTNGLRWNLENRICFAAGRNPKNLTGAKQQSFSVGQNDLSFNPRTEEFEVITGGVQFGHSMDDWGTRFVCSNSNHIQQVVFPQRYLSRNPALVVSGVIRDIASDGPSGPVFRISPPEPWRIVRQKWRAAEKGYKLVVREDGAWEFLPLDPSKKAGVVPTEYPVGFFTSATGVTIYRGDAYPEEFRGNAFVGDVGGNLIHRKTLRTDSVVYTADRADQGTEIVASTDNWFRPVNFVNAPDGTLYVLDMYRETIEHPHSIPEEIKRFLYLTSGSDRGRIYRLVSPDMSDRPTVFPGNLSGAELVQQLESANAWNRETAQRLIWERQDRTLVPAIESLLMQAKSALGRLHALYSLDGLGALRKEHVLTCLNDSEPRLRTHAIRLAERFADDPGEEIVARLTQLANDESEHVRFQLALSLGEFSGDMVVQNLTTLALDERMTNEIRTAILSSARQCSVEVALTLLDDHSDESDSRRLGMVSDLAVLIGSGQDSSAVMQLLNAVSEPLWPLQSQRIILAGIGQGLERRGSDFSRLLKAEDARELRNRVQEMFHRAGTEAENEAASQESRRAAIEVLGFDDSDDSVKILSGFLSTQTPIALQTAAVSALGVHQLDSATNLLIDNWRGMSPQIRRMAIDVMLSRTSRVKSLLSAVESGSIRPHEIERSVKQQLLAHRDATIRGQCQRLFGGDITTSRSQIVEQHRGVLKLTGRAENGETIFRKICSSCHRVGETGHQVAPDLSSVRNKSEEDLLIAVLDPNREAQPNFNTYTVLTQQGRSFSGIIAVETANSMTLRRAEAKEDVILRSNIEELISNGVSLMPEGLEKDLSDQDLADVIAFVKSIGSGK